MKSRTLFVLAFTAGTTIVALVAPGLNAAVTTGPRPNIVLFISDDHGALDIDIIDKKWSSRAEARHGLDQWLPL